MPDMNIQGIFRKFTLNMAGVLNRRSFAIKALSVIVPVIAPLVFCSPAFCLQKTAKIGVLAYRGAAEALQMWSPTAAYLSAHVPNYHFSVIPLTFREIGPAVRNGEVDFVVANTSIYVELETQYGISRIATIKNKSRLGGFTVFGGVIFCRTDRRDIREIGDLKGRSFMAVDETSLGGWQAAWKELKGHGIEPHRDFKGLRFGDTHDAVVHAVLNGKVDAGTVRTDTLEHMAADGKIDLQAFRIINEQRVEGFPYALSTRLYPEWPFAKLRHADNELAQKVVIALLRLAPDSRAAKAAKIMGWTVPLDYEPVHELLKGLRMGPYKDYGKITLSAAIRHHWHWAALALLTVLLMAAATSYVFALNRRLALSQGRLEEAKNSLEREVRDRTAKLSESEERYRLIVDTSLEGIITIDPRGEIVLSNNRMAEMLGRTREELLGGLLVSFVHEDEALDHEKQHNLWLQGKTSYYERRFRKKDGTVTWTSATATPLFNQDGTLRGASGLFTDITERKKAEKDLQRERDRAERYLDIAGVMFATLNTEGEICLVNKKGCSILGYDDESELLGRDWFEVCLPGTVKDSVKGVFDQLMAGDVEPVEYYENPVVTKAGDERIIAFHNTVLYDPLSKRPSGILFSGEDITDRYKMDRALRETNEMLETLVRASPLAIVVFDGDGNVALWNPAAERIFGWNAQEVLGRFNPIVGEEKKQEFLALLDRVMHGESLSSVSLRRSKKDGSVIDVSVSSAPMRNAAHEPVGIISVIADITARKQAEAERENLIADIRSALDAVNRSKQEWQETFDSITDMISIHDRDYNVIKANKAFSANLGKTPQEVINRKCYELMHHGGISAIAGCPHERTMRNKEFVSVELFDEITKKTFSVSTYPYLSPDGDLVGSIHIARDITEEKDREMRMIMTERLASLGQMAAGIAHEINNPLQSVVICSEMLLMKVAKDNYDHGQFEKYLKTIDEEVQRCRDITSNMLSFSRQTTQSRSDIDVHLLMDKAVDLVGYQGRLKNVTVIKKYGERFLLSGNEGELRQVFLVLIINALDAMENKGVITLETGAGAGNAWFRVTDTGPGIAPENIQRIFNPFFSTKTEKGGTGLGLSIAHRIIANHRGSLTAVSEQGHGAAFTVTLPR